MITPPPPTHLEGVVLAAGSSLRAGTFKPGLMLGGRPMIERSIEGMREVCDRIIVVGGFAFGQLRGLLQPMPDVECVENPVYRLGMFTSVKAGLSCVRGERCFLLPADTPLVPARVYRALAASDALISVPTFRGSRGHPVCLMASLIPAILREPDTSSLREFIHRTGSATVEVDAEEILLDIDTSEDYERMVQQLSGKA